MNSEDGDDAERDPGSEIENRAVPLNSDDEKPRLRIPANLADAITVEYGPDQEGSVHLTFEPPLEPLPPASAPAGIEEMPAQIGRFRLDAILGVGGFGVVYKAFDPTLNRLVALKVPRLHSLAGKELLQRFQREARAAAALDHPNIVPIYETGQEEGVCFIAAAYCPGPNLAAWLKEQSAPVSVRLAAALSAKLGAAVEYSHTRGILHRDLKPSNVLLVPAEPVQSASMPDELPFVPRLTDFGLAVLLEQDLSESLLKAQTFQVGTPAYMAPEQTGKRGLPVGPPADVYAMGVILYEMLTGRTPFLATNVADVFDQIRHREPIAPRQIRREIPRDLETICLKCLDKNPARRFPTAQSLADELGRFLRDEPILSHPVGALERCLRWCRRSPTEAALVGVSVAAVVAIVGLLVAHLYNLEGYNRDLTDLNEKLDAAVSRARVMQHTAEENESQTMEALYAADINRIAVAWKDGDTLGMTKLLDRHVPKPNKPDRRGFEWWYLHRQVTRPHRTMIEVESPQYVLSPSPDGRLIGVAGRDATVRLFDVQTGRKLHEIATGQTEVNGLAFSPDRKELATAGDDGTIRFWNLATGKERLKIQAFRGKVFQLIFTPEGREIISGGDSPLIRVFDAQSGEERHQLTGHLRDVQSLVLGADGKSLTSASFDGTAKQWDLQNWNLIRSIKCVGPVVPIVLLEDRDQILVGTVQGDLQSICISTNRQLSCVKDLDRIESLALHPNGALLAAGSRGGRIRLWNLGPQGELTESPLLPWQAHPGIVYSLVWATDGSQLISAGDDGRVLSWNQRMAHPNPRRIEIENASDWCLVPSTELLLLVPEDKSPAVTTLLDWRITQQVARITGTGHFEVTASRDGRYVASLNDQQELQLMQLQTSADEPPALNLVARWAAPGRMQCLRFSPDSKSIAVSHWDPKSPQEPDEHFVSLLKLPGLEPSEPIPVNYAKAVAYSPDSRQLALATRAGLTLWDIENHCVVWEAPQINVSYLTFSPDGRLIVTGGDDRLVIVRNSSDGAIRNQLAGHRARIRSLAFSPDGRTLATASVDGALKIWNVAIGQELLEFSNPGMAAGNLEFSANGKELFFHIKPWQAHEREEILIFDTAVNED